MAEVEMAASRQRETGAPPVTIVSDTPGKPRQVDLTETLAAMQYRKIFRYHRGAYKKSRPMAMLLLFVVMAGLTIFDTLLIIKLPSGTIVSFSTHIGPGREGAVQIWALLGLALAAFVQMKLKQLYSLQWLHTMAALTVALQIILFALETHSSAHRTVTVSNEQTISDITSVEGYIKRNAAGLLSLVYIIASFSYILFVAIARQIFPSLAKSKHFVPVIKRVLEPDPLVLEELVRLRQSEIESGTDNEGRLAHARCIYSGKFWWSQTRQTECQYTGHINDAGRPDGFGIWEDKHVQGESLEGYWQDGIPVGPFRARETGSGSGFVRIRVGFVKCREESIMDIKCMPSHAPFSIGVASAECCVSGAFFHEHPLMTPRYENKEVTPGEDLDFDCRHMLGDMITLGGATESPSSVSVFADAVNGIQVTGFRREPRTLESLLTISVNRLEEPPSSPLSPAAHASRPHYFTSSVLPDVEESKSVGNTAEADCAATPMERYRSAPLDVVSVEGSTGSRTGMNSFSTKRGLVRQVTHKKYLRQQYDPHLQINGWQALSGVKGCEVLIHIHGYNSACQHGIKNIAQLWTFASFPTHIKPVVFSWPTGALTAYPWAQTKGAENNEVARSLREFIISLAAAGVRDFHFQTHSMGARMLMHALPFIQSLFHNSGPDSTSRFHSSMGSDPQVTASDVKLDIEPSDFDGRLRMVNVILMNPEYGLHQFVKTCAPTLDRICDITTVYGDLKDAALFFSYVMNNLQMKILKKSHATSWLPTDVTASQPCRGIWKQRDTCLGLHIYDVKDEDQAVRVDMIDCTFLQSNVQGGRHNTFTLNRSVIDDIFDVVVNRRPAMQRSHRLEPRGGNVYSFLVAPSHVVAP